MWELLANICVAIVFSALVLALALGIGAAIGNHDVKKLKAKWAEEDRQRKLAQEQWVADMEHWASGVPEDDDIEQYFK